MWIAGIQTRLLTLSDSLARLTTAEELAELSTPEDMAKPLYRELKWRLNKFAVDNAVLYAYYVRLSGQDAHSYIVDSDFNPATVFDLSTKPIPLNSSLREAFGGRRTVLGIREYVDHSEGLLSAFSPLRNREGKITALAGVDVSDAPIIQNRRTGWLLTLLLAVSAGAAIACGGLSLALYRRKFREAPGSNLAAGEVLHRMSREARIPLNAVIGLSELTLGDQDLPGEARENTEKVRQSGAILLGIINDTLDLFQIEAGAFELHPAEYDLPSLINDTLTLNIPWTAGGASAFALNISETLPAKLLGDDQRLRRIFHNLLDGAFARANQGRVEWNLSCARDPTGVWLVSSVRDSGAGFRPEDLKNLFRLPGPAEAGADQEKEGASLGLVVTRRMVELMGGSLTVESEYGQGSLFTVWLRQGYVNDAIIGEAVAKSLRNFTYLKEKSRRTARLARLRLPYARVLVVDDVPTNLDVARGMLKPYGMKIDCVTSGEEAIRLIREGVKYSAVFMDHMMPGMDGVEAVRVIREEIGTDYAGSVPIIALTANAIRGNEEVFLQQGFQAFLAKPLDPGQLDSVIHRWVRDTGLEERVGPSALEMRFHQDRRNGDERRTGLERRRDSGPVRRDGGRLSRQERGAGEFPPGEVPDAPPEKAGDGSAGPGDG
ncbi:MAG: response regulator [Treponema sp.]|nr:response regulator [Treponema sp.]